MESLTEGLGFGPEQKLLILSADLLGTTHAATAAGIEAMRHGCATTASLMMPGVWARYAVDRVLHTSSTDDDLGVHLTLNSDLDGFRWGPLTHAPSLLDGDGGFPRTPADLWDHADLDEVRLECRAQLERARLWGIDVTHLSTHLNALQQRPEFFDIYLDLACEYDLPLRLEGPSAEVDAGFPFRSLAAEQGVLMPDHHRFGRGGTRSRLANVLDTMTPGVTEIVFEPAMAAEELRAIDPAATDRIDDLVLLTDRSLPRRLEAAGVVPIGYRGIRDLQRSRR